MKTKKTMKLLLTASFIAVVGAVLASALKIDKALAAPNSTVYFSPSSVSPSAGSEFTLDAKINPGSNQVIGVELHISYDPTKVQMVSMTKNNSALNAEIIPPTFNNTTGKAEMSYFTSFSATPPTITTDSVVATIVFRAVGTGTTSISYEPTTIIADLNDSGNVVSTRTPATVNIGAEHPTYGIADFQNLVTDWLKSMQGSLADVNADNVVNSRDLGIMMSYWLELE